MKDGGRRTEDRCSSYVIGRPSSVCGLFANHQLNAPTITATSAIAPRVFVRKPSVVKSQKGYAINSKPSGLMNA